MNDRCRNTVDLELGTTDTELEPFDEREQLSLFGASQVAPFAERPAVRTDVKVVRRTPQAVPRNATDGVLVRATFNL